MWFALALLPLRLAVMTAAEFVCYLAVLAATCNSASDRPLSRWRRMLLSVVLPLASRLVLWSVGFWRLHVIGIPSSNAKVFVSNHLSLFDGFVLTALLPRSPPSFVAKAEGLANLPLYGRILQAMQVIFVDRTSAASRKVTMERLASRYGPFGDSAWPPLVVFPEGTTAPFTPSLLPFQLGAFRLGQPVQPVVIRYSHIDLSAPTTSGWESGVKADIVLILRAITSVRVGVEVVFLPVYVPSEEARASPELFAQGVKTAMETVASKHRGA